MIQPIFAALFQESNFIASISPN